MKLRTSFFNMGLLKQDFKQHGWISLAYFVALIFIIPMNLLMIATNPKHHLYDSPYLSELIYVEFGLLVIFVIGASIATGMFIFRYLHVKESADAIHSLPVLRRELYFTHVISGLIMLCVPTWLTAIVTWIVYQLVPMSSRLSSSELFATIGVISLMSAVIYIFTVGVSMITGQFVAQGALTVILLFLPTGLMALIGYHLSLLLFGFSSTYLEANGLSYWSPLVRIAMIQEQSFDTSEVILYCILAIVFLVAGYLLYKARHIETATDTISFKLLKPIFRYGVTFCMMLVGGAYFVTFQQEVHGWLYFGYAVGAIGGYFVAEMVLQKTWRVFELRLVKGFLIYTIVIIVLVIGLNSDILGYETRVPELEQIEGAYYGSPYGLNEKLRNDQKAFENDPAFVESIRELHEKITTDQPKASEGGTESEESYTHAFIAYKLKSGGVLVRQYTVSTEAIEEQLRPIYESKIYKDDYYALDQLDIPADRMSIESAEYVLQKSVVLSDPLEIEEFQQLLKEDIYALRYDEMADSRKELANVSLLLSNDERSFFRIGRHYRGVEQWLEQKGYLSTIQITPEEVAYIEVARVTNQSNQWIHPEEIFGKVYSLDQRYEIESQIIRLEDQEDIAQALQLYGGYSGQEMYYVMFTTIKGKEFYGSFREKQLPAFMSNYF